MRDADSGRRQRLQRSHLRFRHEEPARGGSAEAGRGNRQGIGCAEQGQGRHGDTAQLDDIVKQKMADLNARTLENARRMIEGTARSMGIEVVD